MNFIDIIAKKRDGRELTREEIEYFAFSAADGSAPDYQLSAALMAIRINGLNDRETFELTDAMARSGEKADLSRIEGVKGDKHSTGGVGDKTTLVAAPIAAECGVKIAKMSGRGLGFTGGTIDKLEAVPGFRSSLTRDEFVRIVAENGLCVAGQSGNLCPADKKLYALRDVTATVDDESLIASSVMSKKLAAGADIIVLDVKCGSGAFMKNVGSARRLARKMVKIGARAGKKTAAFITNMDAPLGRSIGNSLEMAEAAETLRGNGPDDLTELSLALAAKLLELAGKGGFDECRKLAESKINDGSALKRLAKTVELQGGDARYIINPSLFGTAPFSRRLTAPESGYIIEENALAFGRACAELGAGRRKKDDAIDPNAGIILLKKIGEYVEKGEAAAVLLCSDESLFGAAELELKGALAVSKEKPKIAPVVLGLEEGRAETEPPF